MPSSISARLFIGIVVLSGFAVLGNALMHAGTENRMRFVCFLLVACLAARLKVKLPGVTGTMSVNLPFILVAVAEMNAAEALLVGCFSALTQCLPQGQKKFNWVQAIFNFANMALAIGAARLLYNSAALESAVPSRSLLLAVAAAGYFAVNSIPVAIIMGLTEKRSIVRGWVAMLQLSYPYYLAGAGVAGAWLTASPHIGWQAPLIVLPLMAGVFYSYRRYFAAESIPTSEPHPAPQSATAVHVSG